MRAEKHRASRMTSLIGVLGLVILTGCSSSTTTRNTHYIDRPAQVPAQPAAIQARADAFQPEEGSLWVERGGLTEMFIDQKARRVGDIVTIKIVEAASASNKASTNTDRKSDLSVGLTNFFNLEQRFPSTRKFFNPFSPVESTYDSEFEGAGSTVRSGALEAYITARIVQQLPNGNLMIEGNREVRVNNENQIITLTGMVRPQDISADNIILSTYIADAQIAYSGSGVVNDRQRPGWLTRLLDIIWPF